MRQPVAMPSEPIGEGHRLRGVGRRSIEAALQAGAAAALAVFAQGRALAGAAFGPGIALVVGMLAFDFVDHRDPTDEARAAAPAPKPLVPRPLQGDPELAAVTGEQKALLAAALEQLPERQRYVIAQRYGLDGAAVPLKTIARTLGISPQRTKAIEQAALHDLAIALAPLVDDLRDI
jgi:DNA-directed RNA polymerase specialized sigma24 family protein